MINNRITRSLILLVCSIFSTASFSQNHPGLILTKLGVEEIRANLGQVPLFDATLKKVTAEIDAEIASGIHIPQPKDYSGGYSHERHKRNFIVAQKAGMLFQILDDDKYAIYLRDMLFEYESIYEDLPIHPQTRSYARGKLFWQCLNDSNWLVYMAQAYDTIYDWLSPQERERLENNLFRPFADFISIENPQFYNRVHNHSTWGTAAVGMIGLVMNDDELIQRALYGINDDGLKYGLKDNDGGFIKVEGQKAGFLANLEEPFSPDGYFTEGPYYQRFAMYPFLIFALAMHNKKPELGVLEYKDGVLMKAVTALLNLSDADGEFFLLNDAQKGMSYNTDTLVSAINIAYYYGGLDPKLLSIGETQNRVLLDQTGLAVAKDIEKGKSEPFVKKSVNLSDGPNGSQGGVSVIRYGNEDLSLVFKYTAHGLSHGHYDKLSFSLFEHGDEVLQDYGLVRFVNIEQKGGGNYLKENNTWAKQTVAHNTLVQNETSHFNGDYATGSQHHSFLHFYNDDNENIQIVSAKEVNAYPGTELHRTMTMIKHQDFEKPFVLDLLKVSSKRKNQYDLPFYYLGQIIDTNFDYQSSRHLQALGKSNGYQHLYLEGKGSASDDNAKFTWLSNQKYYTLTSAVDQSDEILLTRLGANDPKFNLRRDAGFMLRRKNTKSTVFASIIEPHGSYSPVTELSLNSNSNVDRLNVIRDDKYYTAVDIKTVNGGKMLLIVANTDASDSKNHRIKISNKTYKWQGPFFLEVN